MQAVRGDLAREGTAVPQHLTPPTASVADALLLDGQASPEASGSSGQRIGVVAKQAKDRRAAEQHTPPQCPAFQTPPWAQSYASLSTSCQDVIVP